MSVVPPQGFRHAVTLLLAGRVRTIPGDASSRTTQEALERLAHELVGLADDTRAPAEVSDWLIAEFSSTLERMPQTFDRDAARSAGAAILAGVAARTPAIDNRDVFLIYVPEDRLPVAAPLAVELTKRRVSVAFADYEVATAQQFADALAHGLARHRGGVVLWSQAFERAGWQLAQPVSERIRILRDAGESSAASQLADWARGLKAAVSKS